MPTSSAQRAGFGEIAAADIQGPNPQQLASPPDQLTKFPNTDDTGSLSGWIEALGVDSSYRPPVEPPIKPAACFYILRRDPLNPDKHEYYRAVYLMQRTLKDFTNSIALKWNLEPTKIKRTLHVLQEGLEVEVDEDVIKELSEGQDMILEMSQLSTSQLKREGEMAVDVPVDSDAGATQNVVHTDGYELKLIF
jgi:hypothetical protein